ncbi:MAG TPA: RNase adapter RapZ [Polyangiaceae bacterium]|nr:RNase adapter RapZ [Polyangiaceae bacterium]
MVERCSVVIVAGLSGAGRSTTLGALEDLGYYCVDNLPPTAFGPTLQACAKGNLQHVAFGIDVRVRSFLDGTVQAIDEVKSEYPQGFTLLFLDASDASLLARYSATRRPHPLTTETSERISIAPLEGIHLERERLAPLRAAATLVLDTSALNAHELRRKIVASFRPEGSAAARMRIRFVSFGFKYGTPSDLDLLFDARFIDNPHFHPNLKPLSGKDEAVRAFVRGNADAQHFADHIAKLLEFAIPKYEGEGKSYLTVGFGCTGGRHRSVALAEWLKERLVPLVIEVQHRDVTRVEGERADEQALETDLKKIRD